MLTIVKRGLGVFLLLLLPTIASAAPDSATDDFSSKEWELTPYLKGTPEQIRELLNGETERLIRKVKEIQVAIQQNAIDSRNDEKVALDTLHKSPLYRQTAAEKAAAETELQTARQSGTPQEKLDASSKFNKLRTAVEKMEYDAVAKCEPLAQDRRSLSESQKNLKNFTEALEKAVSWRAELLDATRNGFMLKGPIADGSKGTLPRITVEKVVDDTSVLVGFDLLTFDMEHPGKDREGIKVFPARQKRVHILVNGFDTKGLKVGEKTSLDRVFIYEATKRDPDTGVIYVVKPYPCEADQLFQVIVPLKETMPEPLAKAPH